jgi:DNA polymerase III subunit alpha
MNQVFKFPDCDCSFPILGYEDDGRPKIQCKFDLNTIPLDCPRVWKLISSGNTVGLFQLESRFGSQLAKQLKPQNIEQLAALVAIIRPGPSQSIRDGKAVTYHYIDRKNGEEEVTYFHPALENILKPTFGEMIYQEQMIQIARDIAGFSLEQADVLRKAISKKKADVMAKVKTEFLEGIKQAKVVSEQEGEELFDWIEKSQRYAFNKSHSVGYALNCYLSAYAKAHFTKAFFTSYLYYANEKPKPHEEIAKLINNARLMNIEVLPPSFQYLNKNFSLKNNKIHFGLTNIKGIGKSVIDNLYTNVQQLEQQLGKSHKDWTWIEFLIYLSPDIKTNALKALIVSGALDHLNITRSKMLFEYDIFHKINKRELAYIKQNARPKTVHEIIQTLVEAPIGRQGGCANIRRAEKIRGLQNLIENPPSSLEDSPIWISEAEEDVLGISLTCSIVDGCETAAANATIKEYLDGAANSSVILMAVEIDKISEIRTKKGKNPGQKMCFLDISDNSATMEGVVIFPNVWSEYGNLLIEGNTVMISGMKKKDSFIVNRVYQI